MYHYYADLGNGMQRITEEQAAEITARNHALSFDRWDEIIFIIQLPAEY